MLKWVCQTWIYPLVWHEKWKMGIQLGTWNATSLYDQIYKLYQHQKMHNTIYYVFYY